MSIMNASLLGACCVRKSQGICSVDEFFSCYNLILNQISSVFVALWFYLSVQFFFPLNSFPKKMQAISIRSSTRNDFKIRNPMNSPSSGSQAGLY